MNKRQKTFYEVRAKVIKAMAHPSRLYIVDLLAEKDRCVNDLTRKVGVDMSTVSKHLSILKNAGIIENRKTGTTVYYHLKMPCIMNFFGCVESVLKTSALEQLQQIR